MSKRQHFVADVEVIKHTLPVVLLRFAHQMATCTHRYTARDYSYKGNFPRDVVYCAIISWRCSTHLYCVHHLGTFSLDMCLYEHATHTVHKPMTLLQVSYVLSIYVQWWKARKYIYSSSLIWMYLYLLTFSYFLTLHFYSTSGNNVLFVQFHTIGMGYFEALDVTYKTYHQFPNIYVNRIEQPNSILYTVVHISSTSAALLICFNPNNITPWMGSFNFEYTLL